MLLKYFITYFRFFLVYALLMYYFILSCCVVVLNAKIISTKLHKDGGNTQNYCSHNWKKGLRRTMGNLSQDSQNCCHMSQPAQFEFECRSEIAFHMLLANILVYL
jgi:hypothetical protein